MNFIVLFPLYPYPAKEKVDNRIVSFLLFF